MFGVGGAVSTRLLRGGAPGSMSFNICQQMRGDVVHGEIEAVGLLDFKIV